MIGMDTTLGMVGFALCYWGLRRVEIWSNVNRSRLGLLLVDVLSIVVAVLYGISYESRLLNATHANAVMASIAMFFFPLRFFTDFRKDFGPLG